MCIPSGKFCTWLFTREVYDGHEEDYGNDTKRRLAHRFPSYPQFAFIDELVSKTVRRNPSERVASAVELANRVQRVTNRIEAGGRVLDLRIPQQCLYCAEGHYRPAYDVVPTGQYAASPQLPDIEKRRNPDDPSRFHPLQGNRPSIYETLVSIAKPIIGLSANSSSIPLLLICDYCGNVQYFRLDLTSDRRGENWRP